VSRLCGGWRPWRGGLAPPKRVRVWAAATVVPVSRLMGGDRVGGRWGGAAKMRAYVTSGSAPKSDTIKRSSTPRRVDSHAARVAWLACWWQEFNMPVAAGSAGLYTRGARRNLRMCFRLIQAVSTRRATQSCIDPAFWAEPFWRPGARHTRSKTKGAPTRSSLGERGAVPAGLIGLFRAPSPGVAARLAHRCVSGPPRNLQRHTAEAFPEDIYKHMCSTLSQKNAEIMTPVKAFYLYRAVIYRSYLFRISRLIQRTPPAHPPANWLSL